MTARSSAALCRAAAACSCTQQLHAAGKCSGIQLLLLKLALLRSLGRMSLHIIHITSPPALMCCIMKDFVCHVFCEWEQVVCGSACLSNGFISLIMAAGL